LGKPNAEREVIKCMLFDAERCMPAFELLKPQHFFYGEYRHFFEEMCRMSEEGKEINPVTLTENARFNQNLLDELVVEAITASGIRSYCDVVLNNYYKRAARKRLIDALSAAQKSEATPESIRADVEDLAYFLADRADLKGLRHTSEYVKDSLVLMDKIVESGSPGIPTGFHALDSKGFSMRPGKMIVIGARPRMGKSALALDITEKCGQHVAFFSLEMDGQEQIERMLSKRTNLSGDQLRNKSSLCGHMNEITHQANEISKMNIWWNDSPTISPLQLLMQCKRLKAEKGLGLVVVDYLGYISEEGKRYESRRIEVGHYSRMMKMVAKTLKIPVIVLSQLNRECEGRSDKRPNLGDLRESGDIEQDADQVWFIYRDEIYNEQAEPGRAEILIDKNRGGPVGKVILHFDGRTTSFKDYTGPTSTAKEDWQPT